MQQIDILIWLPYQHRDSYSLSNDATGQIVDFSDILRLFKNATDSFDAEGDNENIDRFQMDILYKGRL